MYTEIESNSSFDINDIEDIEFTPVNEGLGFNPNKAKKVLSDSHQSQRIKIEKPVKKIYNDVLDQDFVNTKKNVPAELQAFYSGSAEVESRVASTLVFDKKQQEDASMVLRFMSWLIDISSVTLVFLVIHGLMFISTNLELREFLTLIKVNIAFPVLMFLFIYNICTIMRGEGKSLGQSILNIESVSSYRNASPIGFLLLKANFELMSIFLLGLPYLLRLDEKIFDNKTISK